MPFNGKKIGILTGGGDCPGLNAVIRAVVKRSLPRGYKVLGLYDGWSGLLEKSSIELDHQSVSGILPLGGTILRTSRTNVLKNDQTIALAFKNFKEMGLHALIAVGGEGTLTVSAEMAKRGMNIIGVPKTIDNDINNTDFTFGFDTAVQIATDAIDRLHTTAESHGRVMVVEVMGRHAGWIATYAGLSGGADAVLVPEFDLTVEQMVELIERRKQRGKRFSIIVVAEGAKILWKGKEYNVTKDRKDDFGRPLLGGVGQRLADILETETQMEARVTVIGHVQRGGTPSARDRVLATCFGTKAADLVDESKWGYMATLRGTQIEAVPLSSATSQLKLVDEQLWDIASSLFG